MATRPPPPPWVILGRVAHVGFDDVEEPEDAYVELASPPRVSSVTVPTSIHPHPGADYDRHPYVLAADAAGLLVHLNGSGSVGFDLDDNPRGTLVMLRDFLPPPGAASELLDERTGSATRIPDRVEPETPGVSNIRKVGLVSLPGSGGADYIIAELQVDFGANHAKLIYFRSSASAWVSKDLPHPDISERAASLSLGWRTDDVISHDGKLWWVSLRRCALLSCDPFVDQPVLRYDDLPEAIAPPYQYRSPREAEADRCVRMSKGKLRFVEITRASTDPIGATMVVMWTLLGGGPSGVTWWSHQYGTMLEQIWESGSYKATGMPEEIPVLAVVHPSNPDVVYFFLGHYLFGVNVPESRVVEFVDEQYQLVEVVAGWRPPPPICWRYVLAWELPMTSLSEELPNQDVHPAAEGCDSSAPEQFLEGIGENKWDDEKQV